MKTSSRVIATLVVLSLGISHAWLGAASQSARAADEAASNRMVSLSSELDSNTQSLAEFSRLLTNIVKVTTPSVVHIKSVRHPSRGGRIEETGSGVILTSEAASGPFVVTNRHVIAGAELDEIDVQLFDGRVLHPTAILADTDSDIAVLRLGVGDAEAARWGDSDSLEIGHIVLAMGSPFGLSRSVTFGIISATGRRSLRLGGPGGVLNQNFLQTDAAINPGNSGGPLVDMHGRIVGINTAIASNSGGNDGIGFSIPSNLVRRIVDELLTTGEVKRAYLGVKLDPEFTATSARRLKLDRLQGARVVEIYPNTPAARAELKFDDVVLEFDGVAVEDENHLINLVSLKKVGTRASVIVWRDGKRVTLEVHLVGRPPVQGRSEESDDPNLDLQAYPTGLTVETLDASLADQVGASSSTRGLLVTEISQASTLAKDLDLYDVIEEVGRKPVRTVAEWNQAIAAVPSGSPVLLKVTRVEGGTPHSRLVVWQPGNKPDAKCR